MLFTDFVSNQNGLTNGKCDFQNFNREVLHVLLKFLEIIKTEVGKKNDSIKDIFNQYLA